MLQKILILVLLLLSVFSYHPLVTDSASLMGTTRSIIYGLAVLSVFVGLVGLNRKEYPRILSQWLITAILLVVEALLLDAITNTTSLYGEVISLLLPLGLTLIGYSLQCTPKYILNCVTLYGIALAFAGVAQIYNNFGGFVIDDQYARFAKNSYGPMISVFILAALQFLFTKWVPKIYKIVLIFLSVLDLTVLITIRARTALFAVIILALFIVFFHFRSQVKNATDRRAKILGRVSLGVLIISVIVIIFGQQIEYIFDYVSQSIFLNKQGDITSGRLVGYQQALNVIGDYPLWGSIQGGELDYWVHNYILLIVSSYGLLGSLILLIFYFMLLYVVLKGSLLQKNSDISSMGFWAVLVHFFTSLAEPTFPFSPGTAVLMAYVLLGWSLSQAQCANSYHCPTESVHSYPEKHFL